MKISFITTGGTIDKVYFDATSEYEVGASSIELILSDAKVNMEYTIQSLFKKDSLDITPGDRKKILSILPLVTEKRFLQQFKKKKIRK